MNGHVLVVKMTISAHKESKDKTLTFRRTFDFVPALGMKFKLTNEEDDEMMIELINIHFDCGSREFVEEQQDEALVQDLRSADRIECVVTMQRMQEYINYYKSFGWEE